MGTSKSIKQLIVDASSTRSAFEQTLQRITEEVIGGNDKVVESAMTKIFSNLQSKSTSNSSKCLTLELLNTLAVIDVRCLDHITKKRLLILKELLSISEVTPTVITVLEHWKKLLSQNPNSTYSTKTAPILDFVYTTLSSYRPAVVRDQSNFFPRHSKDISVRRVAGDTAQNITNVDLASATAGWLARAVKEQDSKSSLPKIRDLLEQCEKENKRLQATASEAAEQGNMVQFDALVEALEELETAINAGKAWIEARNTTQPKTAAAAAEPSKTLVTRKEFDFHSPTCDADKTASELNLFVLPPPEHNTKRRASSRRSSSARKPSIMRETPKQKEGTTSAGVKNVPQFFVQSEAAESKFDEVWSAPTEQSRNQGFTNENDNAFSVTWKDACAQSLKLQPEYTDEENFKQYYSNTPPWSSETSNKLFSNKKESKSNSQIDVGFHKSTDTVVNSKEKLNSQTGDAFKSESLSIQKSDNENQHLDLISKIDELQHKLNLAEKQADIHLQKDFQEKIKAQVLKKTKVYEETIQELRKDANELRNVITQQDEELQTIKRTVQTQSEQIERLAFELKENENSVFHAKEMWLKETTRASNAFDTIEQLEQKLLLKEKQLSLLTQKCDELTRETSALKTIIRPDHNKSFNHTESFVNQRSLTSSSMTAVSTTATTLPHSQTAVFSSSSFPRISQHSSLELREPVEEACLEKVILSPEELHILERFKSLFLNNDDVLYETPLFQLGIKAAYHGLRGTLQLYYGNRSNHELQGFTTSIYVDPSNREILEFTHSVAPQTIPPKQQVCQSIVVTCSDAFDTLLTLRVGFLMPDNNPTMTQLPLPVGVSKFMEGKTLSYTEFFRFWKHKDFQLREVTASVYLDHSWFSESMINIVKTIQLGGALTLLAGIEKHETQMAFAGTFPPENENPSIPKSLVLVRYERGKSRETCRFKIRSDSVVLSRAIREILIILLSSPSRTSYPGSCGNGPVYTLNKT